MAELDRILADAVMAEHVPFVVGMAGNSAGVIWSGAAGNARHAVPTQLDTVFSIFSTVTLSPERLSIGAEDIRSWLDRRKRGPVRHRSPTSSSEVIEAWATSKALRLSHGNNSKPVSSLASPATPSIARSRNSPPGRDS
jgi:hypothetical protein